MSSGSGKKAAQDILLSCTVAGVSPHTAQTLAVISRGNLDWDYLIRLAEFHRIAPLVAGILLDSDAVKNLPLSIKERLERIYQGQLYSGVVLSEELQKVLVAFTAHNIPVIVLKGTLLAEQLYENPGLRTVTDIDILVNPTDIPAADNLIREMGYHQTESTEKWEGHIHAAPYSRQAQFPLFVELHCDLINRVLADVSLNDIWQRTRSLQRSGANTMLMSPEDTLIYLSYQFSRYDNQLLKYLCDISHLLQKYHDILDWDYIVRSALTWKMGTFVYYALKKSVELSGTTPPALVLSTLRPGACRRGLLSFYASKELFMWTFHTPKLRLELFVLVQAMMMQRVGGRLAVFREHRRDNKPLKWLRSILWVVAVTGWVLLFNVIRLILRFRTRSIV